MARKDRGAPARRRHIGSMAASTARLALWTGPILVGLALALFGGAPVDRLRNIVFDEYQRFAPRPWSPDLPVGIVDIDDDSLARYGTMAVAAQPPRRADRPARGGGRGGDRLRRRGPAFDAKPAA